MFLKFSSGRGYCNSEGWIWQDWEKRGIGMHEVKFPRNQ